MSGERCAYLITVAMANNLEEVWISNNPVLLFTYIAQYLPGLAIRCVVWGGGGGGGGGSDMFGPV